MSSMMKKKDWAIVTRKALSPTAIVTALSKLNGWRLDGDDATVAIEKTFTFAGYDETMAFVNAVAFIAKVEDHHPDMSVRFNRCVVRFNTHDVNGISSTDIDCAARVDALLA